MKNLGKSNAFVGHVWTKLKRDIQYQFEEIPTWAIHVKYLQSILLEFDANNTFGKSQLGQTFYDSVRPSIKLWIADIGEDMPWDHLVSAANKAEAKSKIQRSTHLN